MSLSNIAEILPENTPIPPFDANATLGAIQIGVLVSTCLFGIVTVQVYIYSSRFPKDPRWMKLLVFLVWILELGHTISVCHVLYDVTISQYGQPQLLTIPPESLNVAILFSGFIGPLEQGWFAHRIYKFSKSLVLPLFCLLLSSLRLVGSIALAIAAFHRLTLDEYREHWTWLLTSILVMGACTDVILALSLCYYLRRWRGDGFERTTRLIDSLMLWTVETGLITSIGAVALVIAYLTMPENFVWIGLFTVLARLFSNSLLASLNARPGFAQIYHEDVLGITGTERSSSAPRHPVLELTRVKSNQSQQGRSPLLQCFKQDLGMRRDVELEKGNVNTALRSD